MLHDWKISDIPQTDWRFSSCSTAEKEANLSPALLFPTEKNILCRTFMNDILLQIAYSQFFN